MSQQSIPTADVTANPSRADSLGFWGRLNASILIVCSFGLGSSYMVSKLQKQRSLSDFESFQSKVERSETLTRNTKDIQLNLNLEGEKLLSCGTESGTLFSYNVNTIFSKQKLSKDTLSILCRDMPRAKGTFVISPVDAYYVPFDKLDELSKIPEPEILNWLSSVKSKLGTTTKN